MEDDERSTVASRESGDRLHYTIFSTGGLGGVTSQEVVRGLLRREFADWRQDTKGIASEHDDVARLAVGQTWDFGIGDEINGVGTTSVFSDGHVVVVGGPVQRIIDNIFEDRTETDGPMDFGLLFSRKVDTFCIATSLNVEYTSVGPDVFIIADELAVRISRKCPRP
jgi:hypothetical protein